MEPTPTTAPLVSVIIPTYRRPDAVLRAIDSILAQTFTNFEIIVVHDGPDADTAAALHNADPRVRYHHLEVNSGPAAARNHGVLQSRGEWIAFLDDDDEWLPRKLEAQLAILRPGEDNVIITTRCIYRHGDRSDVWPLRPIADNEDLSNYILCREGFFGRPGILSISTFLVPRKLLLQHPLITAPDHEDWSWVLEVAHRAGTRFRFVWEPLVVYTIAVDTLSRSRRMNWRESLDWADHNRAWISSPAYNCFLATKVALKAKRQGDWRGLASITRRVLANSPSLLDLAFLAGMALLPATLLNQAWRHSLKSKERAAA